MKLVDILARELTEWPINATHAVITYLDARACDNSGICFTECGPPVWSGANWTILGSGCGADVLWLTEHDIPNTFGLSQSEENIVSKSEWQSASAAYLASIQPARDPEIAAVVDKPANPWRRNRGRKTPPVPVGTRVDVKYRNGVENYGVRAGFASDPECSIKGRLAFSWVLTGDPGDIMQWRYAEPQQAEEKQESRVIDVGAPCSVEQIGDDGAVSVGYHMKLPEGYGAILEVEVKDESKFNPIALRDEYRRITLECEELSQQMGKLTGRMGDIEAALRAEGFAMVEPQKHNAD